LILEGKDFTREKLKTICKKLGQGQYIESFNGDSYEFYTPDGGVISIGVNE